MSMITLASQTRHTWASAALALLAGAGLDTSLACEFGVSPDVRKAELTQDEAAAQYAANLKRLLETRVIPGLRRGVVRLAIGRPECLTMDVTDDPSPYSVGAKIGEDGSLIVRRSLGYFTMHDAALDAAALAGVLKRSDVLRRYLRYQLLLARANDRRSGRGEPRHHAKTFAEFAQIDDETLRALFAQPDWKRERDRAEVESLGWTVAYLLARVDPTLAGLSSSLPTSAAAARLAAASGWFPAPPFASAFELAEIVRGRQAQLNERVQICRAAEFMAAGTTAVRADAQWRSTLEQNANLKRRVEHIVSEIARMRQDADCGPNTVTSL